MLVFEIFEKTSSLSRHTCVHGLEGCVETLAAVLGGAAVDLSDQGQHRHVSLASPSRGAHEKVVARVVRSGENLALHPVEAWYAL